MKCVFKETDYEEIEEEANNLIMDLGLEQSQLNCFEVAFLLGIALRKYSEVPAYYRTFLMSKSEFGYSIRNEKQYVIYYNDALDKDRIRFSIWNEIGTSNLGIWNRIARDLAPSLRKTPNTLQTTSPLTTNSLTRHIFTVLSKLLMLMKSGLTIITNNSLTIAIQLCRIIF